MKSSVLTLRKPIPLARAIRWVPAGLFTPPRTVDDLALFITQGALRDVMRHLRSNPEQELLGFLLGELYECPETGARYVVVNSAVRTGHAIAESDRILIPEEEWLGVQLEVRRRRTQLVGWYHSAPFVGPHPARADLETHRALFTEPWQCGLVIATSGDAPTGAFFRSLMGERTGGGVLIPFYELPDEDEPLPVDGRKRTFIDWVNYETRGTVERDESERRPFVPPRPRTPQSAPVILSVPSAPADDGDDDEEDAAEDAGRDDRILSRLAEASPPAAPASPTVIPLNPPRPKGPAEPAASSVGRSDEPTAPRPHPTSRPSPSGGAAVPRGAGPNGEGPRASRAVRPEGAGAAGAAGGAGGAATPGGGTLRTPSGSRPGIPQGAGAGLVMLPSLPSAAELQDMLNAPGPSPGSGGGLRTGFRYFLVLLVIAAVALIYLWNSGRVELPGFLAGVPVLDNSGSPTPTSGSTDSDNTFGLPSSRPTNPAALTPPVTESAGASLSAAESTGVGSSPAESAVSTSARTSTSPGGGIAPQPPLTPSTDPAVLKFAALADTLEESIRNFQDRNDDFTVHRITCGGLAVGYRSADDAFIALASAHRAARESLDSAREARYRRLVDQMGRVNEEFGGTGCPRP